MLQQSAVLSELYSYARPDDGNIPEESAEVMATHEYLQACHRFFECGFLSHLKIEDMNSESILNIQQGFYYFKEWCDGLRKDREYTLYLFIVYV